LLFSRCKIKTTEFLTRATVVALPALHRVDIVTAAGDVSLDFIISDFYEVCRVRLTSALNGENAGYLLRKQTRTRQGKHENARSIANNVLLAKKSEKNGVKLHPTSELFFASL